MLADALGQVLVAVRIAGKQAAQLRQHLERMEIVDRLEPGHLHLGKLQHPRLPAHPQHPRDLAQGRVLVGDVAQAEGHGHQVEAGIRERQLLGVALHVFQAGHQAAVGHPVAADREHAGVDVAQHDAPVLANPRLEQGGDVAGASRQVQHPVARLDLAGGHEIALPGPMDAQAHQVVHQVVLAGDRGEHLAHQLLLVRGRDVAEAEVGGARFVGRWGFGGLVHGAIMALPRDQAAAGFTSRSIRLAFSSSATRRS